MSDLVKAANPLGKIETEGEAIAAARMSAVALWLTGAWSAVGVALMTANMDRMQAAMSATAAAQAEGKTAEAVAMADGIVAVGPQIGVAIAVLIAVVQLGLGLLQWKKPNSYLPIIFLLLAGYGLLTKLMAMVMSGSMAGAVTAMNPMWMVAGGVALLIVVTVLHVSGLRGGLKLAKLKG